MESKTKYPEDVAAYQFLRNSKITCSEINLFPHMIRRWVNVNLGEEEH